MPESPNPEDVHLVFEIPPLGYLVDLAPRVRGSGDWDGEYGYALALTKERNVRVVWDDGGIEDIPVASLRFFSPALTGR